MLNFRCLTTHGLFKFLEKKVSIFKYSTAYSNQVVLALPSEIYT